MGKKKSTVNRVNGAKAKLHGVKKSRPPVAVRSNVPITQASSSSSTPVAVLPTLLKAQTNTEFNLFDCTEETLVILVLFPGKDCCFNGSIRVQCIGGCVNIDGYNMMEASMSRASMVNVCAPFKLGRPAIFSAVSLTEQNRGHNRLKYRLKEVTSHFERIMDLIGDKSAAVLLIERNLTKAATVIQELDDDVFVPRHLRSARNSLWFERKFLFSCPNWSMYDAETLTGLDKMMTHLNSKRSEGARCSVITCAGKGAGKSTFLRYFVNRNLEQDCRPIYVLDTDIGQSEFTPNGCLSLWKVDNPLLDVPWTHQSSHFESCYFFGNIQPAHNKKRFSEIFERLFNEFNAKSPPGSMLLINSMGWIEDAGKEILNSIISISTPAYAILLPSFKRGDSDPYLFQVPSCVPRTVVVRPSILPSSSNFSQIFPTVKGLRRLTPAEMRHYTTIGYFSPVLPRPVLSSITDAKSFAIPFSDALFAIPEDLMLMEDEMFFGSINCQLVALCTTPDQPMDNRRLLDMDTMPRIHIWKSSSPLLKCIGFGMIRAIDLDKRVIYVVTPVPDEQLADVSVFARGTAIPLPSPFLTTQITVGSKPYISRIANNQGFLSDLNRCFSYNAKFKRGFYPTNV